MRSELKIDLKKLSAQSLNLSYSQKSKELTEKLRPLIGDRGYNIDISIQSAGCSSYVISGQIQAPLQLLCARCAYEFQKPIHKTFEEKILLQKKAIRIDKAARSHHFSELMSEESWILTEQPLFDLGDFLYELIAIEEPLRPLGGPDCDGPSPACEHLEKMKEELNQSSGVQIHFT